MLADKWPEQIQQCGPCDVAGASLWQGCRGALFSALQDLPWGVGQRPVSVHLRAQPRSLAITDAHAGVVLPTDVCGLPDRARSIVDAVAMVEPAAGCRSVAHAAPGGSRRRSSALSSGASLKASRFCFAVPGRLFHLVQPAARLLGRVQHGLGPWNWRGFVRVVPLPTVHSIWSEQWASDRIASFPTRTLFSRNPARQSFWAAISILGISQFMAGCSGQSAWLRWSKNMATDDSCAAFGLGRSLLLPLLRCFSRSSSWPGWRDWIMHGSPALRLALTAGALGCSHLCGLCDRDELLARCSKSVFAP